MELKSWEIKEIGILKNIPTAQVLEHEPKSLHMQIGDSH